MKIAASICAFCLLFAAAFPAGGQSGHAGYVCPPCDSDCHDKVYDVRGGCPVCGKSLIPRPGAVPNATLPISSGWPAGGSMRVGCEDAFSVARQAHERKADRDGQRMDNTDSWSVMTAPSPHRATDRRSRIAVRAS